MLFLINLLSTVALGNLWAPTGWMIHITSHMSKWFGEAFCIGPTVSTRLSCWLVEEDGGWILCALNKGDKNSTYRTQRPLMQQGQPWRGSFVLRIKLANRPVTGTFSVLKRRDLPEAGLTTLSVLSHYERRGLWYSCTDVALVSSCHTNCKWPSGMWQQREIWMISDCISQADAKTCCFTLWTNKQNSQWSMSQAIVLACFLKTDAATLPLSLRGFLCVGQLKEMELFKDC